jgi:hypothetical protein
MYRAMYEYRWNGGDEEDDGKVDDEEVESLLENLQAEEESMLDCNLGFTKHVKSFYLTYTRVNKYSW